MQLLLGVQAVNKVLRAAAGKFSSTAGAGQVIIEAMEQDSIPRAFARASGGMAVLLATLDSRPEPLVAPQVENLARLWHMLDHLAEEAQEFQPTAAQRQPLKEAFELLAQCADEGSEEKGQQAIQTILLALEPPSQSRTTLIAIYRKGVAKKKQYSRSEELAQLHPISMGFITVYGRIGELYYFLETLPS